MGEDGERGRQGPSLADQGKKLRFHSKYNGKPLKGFSHRLA